MQCVVRQLYAHKICRFCWWDANLFKHSVWFGHSSGRIPNSQKMLQKVNCNRFFFIIYVLFTCRNRNSTRSHLTNAATVALPCEPLIVISCQYVSARLSPQECCTLTSPLFPKRHFCSIITFFLLLPGKTLHLASLNHSLQNKFLHAFVFAVSTCWLQQPHRPCLLTVHKVHILIETVSQRCLHASYRNIPALFWFFSNKMNSFSLCHCLALFLAILNWNLMTIWCSASHAQQ